MLPITRPQREQIAEGNLEGNVAAAGATPTNARANEPDTHGSTVHKHWSQPS